MLRSWGYTSILHPPWLPSCKPWLLKSQQFCLLHTKPITESTEETLRQGHLAALLGSLKGRKDLPHGDLIITHIKKHGIHNDPPLHSLLIEICGKCGNIHGARLLFDDMSPRPKRAWKAIIRAYVQGGHYNEAFSLWNQLQQEASIPDMFTFVSILTTFGGIRDPSNGQRIHGLVVCNGFVSDVAVGTALVNMYGKCGRLDNAIQAFDGIDEPNVMAWNVMMAIHAKHNKQGDMGIFVLHQMQEEGVLPDNVSFVNILSGHHLDLDTCLRQRRRISEQVHARVLPQGMQTHVILGNAVINMYSVFGKLHDAHLAFCDILDPSIISWTSLLQGYSRNGQSHECLAFFERMKQEATLPDRVTYMVILEACVEESTMVNGKRAHACLVAMGFTSNIEVGTAIMQMYGNCGNLDDASIMFNELPRKNLVSWMTFIGLQTYYEQGKQAIQSFSEMLQVGIMPDKMVFLRVIDACGQIVDLSQGMRLYTHLLAAGYEPESSVFMNLYLQCRNRDDIPQVFDDVLAFGVSSWNTMMIACNEHGCGLKTLQLFYQMQQEGAMPNQSSFVTILNASGDEATLLNGKRIHARTAISFMMSDIVFMGSLVSMYGKCGDLEGAKLAFDGISKHNLVSQTALITAYAQHGKPYEALKILDQFTVNDIFFMDDAIFVNLLSSCSRSGSLDEGVMCFGKMMEMRTRQPGLDHYCSIIDLLGRAGNLANAQAFIDLMPCQPSRVLWMALLGACRYRIDLVRGQRVAKHVFELNSSKGGSYAMLSNMYANIQ